MNNDISDNITVDEPLDVAMEKSITQYDIIQKDQCDNGSIEIIEVTELVMTVKLFKVKMTGLMSVHDENSTQYPPENDEIVGPVNIPVKKNASHINMVREMVDIYEEKIDKSNVENVATKKVLNLKKRQTEGWTSLHSDVIGYHTNITLNKRTPR